MNKSKRLMDRRVVAASVAGACLLGLMTLSVAMVSSSESSAAQGAGSAQVVDSSKVRSADKAPLNDLAGRRYRRYLRRHVI